MSRVDRLVRRYERFVSLPWDRTLAGPQRVWFVIYDKTDERRIRARTEEFELATKGVGHGWQLVDLTDSFPQWMAGQEYRESYFQSPEDLYILMPDFLHQIIQEIDVALASEEATDDSVIAIIVPHPVFWTQDFIKPPEQVRLGRAIEPWPARG